MERRIVNHEHRLRLRPLTAPLEQLLEEVLKDFAVRRTLVDTGYQDAVLGIRWEYVVSLAPMDFSVCTGVIPSGDQPVFRKPTLLSQPDSSM